MTRPVSYMNDIRPSEWSVILDDVLEEQTNHALPSVFTNVSMLHGRRRWLTAMPALLLKPDSPTLTIDLERDLVRVALDRRKEQPLGFFHPRKEVTVRDGRQYYSAFFLEQLAPFLALPACAAAVARFVRAVDEGKAKPTKVRPPRTTPPSSTGWDRRWEPWEDDVLRAWFGKRTVGEHAGKHVPLTEREWQLVLQDHLRGRRTHAQVKTRITILNRKLRRSMLVDGFLPRDKVAEFQHRALGEQRIPLPRFRPRIKGRSYRGDNERPVLGQPD